MVKALFDTNILIDFLSGRPEARLEIDLHEERAISLVTGMEVAVDLRRRHRIKLPDALIWAAAKRRGALLVTRNTRNFPGGDPGVRAPYA